MSDLALELQQLSSDYPIALLPVRLETRFSSNPKALRIRIYPDEIFADTHQRALSAAEWNDAVTYWATGWEPSEELDAWRVLTTRYAPGRAAWLVEISKPTNYSARPSLPPEFPVVALRDEVLPEVRAAALPRAWMVIAYRGGVEKHRVTGNDIIEPLALSFAPNVGEGDPSLVNVGDLTIESSLRWAVDYAEAERVGMAVTMPLSSEEDLTEGFDRVVVLGVRTQANEVDGTAILDDLLAAHRFTRGVALVPQGTPTNNTSQALAGYPPPDAAAARFALERTGISLGATSDGLILNSALGLDTKRPIFRHVAGAGGQEQTRAAAMNTALWPCTLGYYLEQMMAPLLTSEQIADTRAHFRDHVRGRGPLPLMRIGRVPYGVLPVTSVVEWEGSDDPLGHGLASFLRPWREAFLARAANVPRVGASNDPDADLLGVLARDAHSREIRSRTVYGPAFIRNLMLLLGESMSALDLARPTHIAQALAEAGLTGLAPRVAQMTLGDRALRIGVELVSKKTLSEIDPLDPNYLHELRTATVAVLRLAGRAGDAAFDNPLLYHLLRQATLVELTRVGTGVAVGAGVADAIDRVERELHRIGPGTDSRLTAWERLDAPITGVTGGQSLGVWLLDPFSTDATRATVREHRAALATLASAPTAELARLTSETLDTCSHRLDAWITSLASRRLAEMREAHDEGVYLGAYGWVENLRPTPRAGTAGGFIHAPSAAHAATAAVLRNAHLTRTGAMRDQAAVDLSSTRVRGALELLDGVRQGLPLGAILGFRLERALHDQQLDQYIAGFRAAFPLGRDPGVAPSGTSERIAARNVADGIAVRTAITGLDADTLPWSTVFPFVAKDDRPGVATVLFALDADVDAAADLLLAESVHQTIQGKTERAAATLASLAGGNAIPDPEVARTPRRGISVTHRVGLLLGTAPALAWPASPRSRAEPRLAAWVEQRLPMATRIACTISYPDPANPPHRRTETVTLDALGLGALDVLALARTTGESGVGELEARLRAYASMEYDARHDVAISHDPSPDLSDVAILDALELARLIDEALRHGRPMTAADLSRVGADASPGLDEIELATRANAAVAEFTAARVNLAATLVAAELDDSAVTAAVLRGALWGVAAFAVRSALPGGVDDADPIERAALMQTAHRVLVDVDRALAASASAATSIQQLQAIFGGTLTVLPTFTPDNATEVDAAISHGPTLVGSSLATRRWFEGAAAVREPLAALRLARMVSEALTSTGGDSRVAQFPHEPGLPWAGGTFASSSPPRAGTVSLVAEMPFGGVSSSGFAGVVFDEWSELIPAASQDTCIAVHHDAPSAEAGQCILLAVPPTRSGSWTLPNLEAVINETLDLAKIRAVDAEQLGVLGLLAPTTFLAVNLADDTVGRDLALYAIDDNLIRNPE